MHVPESSERVSLAASEAGRGASGETPPPPAPDHKRAQRRVFTYAVVTCNGAGVHGTFNRLADAKRAAARIAQEYDWGAVEIERVEHVSGVRGGWPRRYWMRQRKRWVLWNPRRDVDTRNPDWMWTYAA